MSLLTERRLSLDDAIAPENPERGLTRFELLILLAALAILAVIWLA